MKGIVKGSLFSAVLIFIVLSVGALVNIKFSIPDYIFKGVLWILSGICVFAGTLPVARSSAEKKFIRGLGCALTTVILLFFFVSVAGKHIPASGTFYAYALICMLCGILGSLAGTSL